MHLRSKRMLRTSISDLPNTPAVYAIYGGQGRHAYPAYVGSTRHLKTRIQQHLISRDGGVSASTSAVSLNADHVTEVRWWRSLDFRNPSKRRAAESLAAEELNPVLRTRDRISNEAKLHMADPQFCNRMQILFRQESSGCLILPTLGGALDRIAELEQRVFALERQLDQLLHR